MRTPSERAALTLIVTGSFVLRLAASLGRDVQRYLPDEFLYGSLARSVAGGHGLTVLGEHFAFPAVLQPVITSPFWLADDPTLAFRLTQGLNALAMSLAAVPVYALARRVGLRPSTRLLAALAAVATPDLLYAGYQTADALGYLLALTALAAALRTLTEPSRRHDHAAFLGCVAAALARAEYAVLPVATIVAAAVVERGLPRRHPVLLASTAVIGVAGALIVLRGSYASVADFRLDGGTAAWALSSLFLLALAACALAIPGAVTWVAHEIVRPTDRARTSFAALGAAVVGGLVVAAALVADGTGSARFFERYLMVCLPLLVLAGALWLERGAPWRNVARVVALAVVAAAAIVPVAGYSAGQGRADSPFLLAVERLEAALGAGSASLVVALGATALALAGCLRLPRSGGAMLAATIAVWAVVSLGAHAADHELSSAASERLVGSDPAWIDRAQVRGVLLVHGAGAPPASAMLLALSNRSVDRGAHLGRLLEPLVGFSGAVTIDSAGSVRIDGEPVVGPVVLDDPTVRVAPASGQARPGAAGATLLLPTGGLRLAAIAVGLPGPERRAARVRLRVFPTGAPGICRMATLSFDPGVAALTVTAATQPRSASLPAPRTATGPGLEVAVVPLRRRAGKGRPVPCR